MSNSLTVVSGISAIIPSATALGNITATQITGTITASNGGNGQSSLAAGYTFIGNGTTALTPCFYSNRLIAYSSGLSMTATGDQIPTMTSTNTNFIVRRVTIANCVNPIATAIAVAALRSASGGGGSAITGALVFTGLSATTAFLDQAVTLASATVQTTQLYVQVTTAIASATQTLPLQVWGDYLP